MISKELCTRAFENVMRGVPPRHTLEKGDVIVLWEAELTRLENRPITGRLKGLPVTVVPANSGIVCEVTGERGTCPREGALLVGGRLYCSPLSWQTLLQWQGAVADDDD